MNNRPDLNRLGIFHSVYEKQSISRAAESLHVTRSAVSQSIKRLEIEVGQALFTRSKRGLQATQRAHEVFQLIDPVMRSLSEKSTRWALENQEPRGCIRVMAPPMITATMIAPRFAEFRKKYNAVRLDVKPLITAQVVDALETDTIDFAIVDSAEVFLDSRSSLKENKWFEDHEVMVASKNYFKSKHCELRPVFERASKYEFVSYDLQGSDTRQWFKTLYRRSPDTISPVFCADSVYAIRGAITSHLGFGLLPENSIASEIKSGELIQLFPRRKQISNKVSFLSLKAKEPGLAPKLFLDSLHKSIA